MTDELYCPFCGMWGIRMASGFVHVIYECPSCKRVFEIKAL